nr:MAG TPA: hypothetical protein [Caudoviricetes sp.]
MGISWENIFKWNLYRLSYHIGVGVLLARISKRASYLLKISKK